MNIIIIHGLNDKSVAMYSATFTVTVKGNSLDEVSNKLRAQLIKELNRLNRKEPANLKFVEKKHLKNNDYVNVVLEMTCYLERCNYPYMDKFCNGNINIISNKLQKMFPRDISKWENKNVNIDTPLSDKHKEFIDYIIKFTSIYDKMVIKQLYEILLYYIPEDPDYQYLFDYDFNTYRRKLKSKLALDKELDDMELERRAFLNRDLEKDIRQ